jgi:hypothetical protein
MKIRYKHLFGSDLLLWEKFLERHGEHFDRFEYDIRLGQGVPIKEEWPKEIAYAASMLTRKRVDVVGYRDEEVWIFEIKPDASLSALGQLLAYEALWIKERGRPPILYKAVVTDRLGLDEEFLFDHFGIKTYVIPIPELVPRG